MKVTALEVRSHQLKKSMRGYDVREVEAFRDIAAEALEDANREIISLGEKLSAASERLVEYRASEETLKDTLTTAHKLTEDLKKSAAKEAEIIIAEARAQAGDIIRQSQERAARLQEDIFRLKKQRTEIEVSIRALIDYHSSALRVESDEAKRADEEAGAKHLSE